MKKLKTLKLEALSNMLTREQMKKLTGGYGPCNGYGGSCPGGCCPNLHCGSDPLYQNRCVGN